nr:ParB/RepB/Spo0J family partition protein [Kibdelosporangium sp. MJ126-NF4]
MLAAVGARLPPILVHRASMRVIDGRHRLRAAMLRGQDTIEARLVDCPEAEVFLLGVQENIAHGLPLSLRDRQAAAARVLVSCPHMSDRAVAVSCGLSASGVAAVRRRIPAGPPRPSARIGRDGRVRPVDAAAGRVRASELIAAHPDASLREIAALAGISPVTVRDVRQRLNRGEDPVPAARQSDRPVQGPVVEAVSGRVRDRGGAGVAGSRDPQGILRTLKNDPSLRFTENGRLLLRWLDSHVAQPTEWTRLLAGIPPHSAITLAELAKACAATWQELGQHLERNQSTG